MLLKFVGVAIGLPWTLEVTADLRVDDELSSLVNTILSDDIQLHGYVSVIDSHCGFGSPVYFYCIQVAHRIEEAEIIKKIENCAPPQQLPRNHPVWRVKPVNTNKDNGHHAKGSRAGILTPPRASNNLHSLQIVIHFLHIKKGIFQAHSSNCTEVAISTDFAAT